jgi:UDP-2,4-diacetamido-2,4,6-trideoxy-beta-L-altropyranose hydrolase
MQRGWRTDLAASAPSLAAPVLNGFARTALVVDPTLAGEQQAGALLDQTTEQYDLLVVDHYDLDAHFELRAREFAKRILVIDDLADRPHHCDWLLDQGGHNTPDEYSVNTDCVTLMGPQYALLRPEFAELRDQHRPWLRRHTSLSSIAICMGATDPQNVTSQVLDSISGITHRFRIGIFTTGANPNLDQLRQKLKRAKLGTVQIHVDHPSLADTLRQVDLVIGAGGISAWERCALGLPSVVIATADNQQGNLSQLARHGAARVMASGDIASKLSAILEATTARELDHYTVNAALHCDGRGVNRVLGRTVCTETARDGSAVSLRPATPEDAEQLLAWQAAPSARAFARNPDIPSSTEHSAWMQSKLTDPDALLCIIICGGNAVGMLRLDRLPTLGTQHTREISILISETHQRRGIARCALSLGQQLIPHATLVGEVLPGNESSHRLFQRSGFVFDGRVYVKEAQS